MGLLGVPSAAGTHGPGQEKAPRAVRDAGLIERLNAMGVEVDDYGDLPLAPFTTDPAHRNQQNLPRVVDVVRQVADRVGDILAAGSLPLIIGGDCTITLGVVAAYVERRPNVGLLYFDGDIDVSTPDATTSGVLDTMGMAHLLGHGAGALAGVGPRRPLLAGDHVVAFGYDERDSSRQDQRWLAAQGVACHPSNHMISPAEDAADAWSTLAAGTDSILVHFDVDAIDSTEFPLADFPHFNQGLPYDGAISCLRTFCSGAEFAGLVVTEVNPNRDPERILVERLVADLATALA